jgi:hypothetical protein
VLDSSADHHRHDREEENESEKDETDEDDHPELEKFLRQFVTPRSSDFPQHYKSAFQRLKLLSLQLLSSLIIYRDIYEAAERFLLDYDRQIDPTNHQPRDVIQHFRQERLFGDLNRLSFRWDVEIDPNSI